MEWTLRKIWRLYPPAFRARFGRELERDLERRRAEGRVVGFGLIADAMVTLVRAWTRTILVAVAPDRALTDARLALRSLRRSPGYALIVVAILSISLGANTAVFSVTHAVLLDVLPYGSPERVYTVEPARLTFDTQGSDVDPEFAALPQVESAALYVDGGGANFTRSGATIRVTVAQATDAFFRALGVTPLLGHDLTGTRGTDVVVLSYGFWLRAFGAEPGVLGTTVELNGQTFRVIGVMPERVAFPSAVDVWLPFPIRFELFSNAFGPTGIVRTRPGADLGVLRSVAEARLAAKYTDLGDPPPPLKLTSLRDELVGSVRTPLHVLVAIAGLVVLLGCLNLAGLVLARTTARMHEISVRRALGAGRPRIFGALILEVLILASAAGVVSLGTATLTTNLLRRLLPGETPGLSGAGLTGPTLMFAAAVTTVAGLLVGFLPALQGALVDERAKSGRTATDDRNAIRTQGALVVGQVALASVLVTGAALLGHSLAKLEAVPMGYDLEHVLTFQVRLPEAAYPDSAPRAAYLRNVETALAGIPGVSAAGATTLMPQQDAVSIGLGVTPQGAPEEDAVFASWVRVSEGYFSAMGIPIAEGRPFSQGAAGRWDRVVMNEELARRLYPEGPLADRAVTLYTGEKSVTARIEAVVGDVHLRSQRSGPSSILYTSLVRSPSGYLAFAVRATGSPTLLADRVRQVAASVDPSVPPFNVTTTGEAAARRISTERAVAVLSRMFSLAALVLAALGLYGLVSQKLERRRRELGIRVVLGARPAGLVWQAMLGALTLVSVGLLLGLVAAVTTVGYLSTLLFEVPPKDPVAFASVVVAVIGVTAVASWLPARRVAAVDPIDALRAE